MQMGSGTVDPALSIVSAWSGPKWGGTLAYNGRMPVSENHHGYKPSPIARLHAGPSYRLTEKMMATTEFSLSREWQAKWNGEPDRMSGRTVLAAGGALIYRLNPSWSVMVQGQSTLMQWSEATLITQRFKSTVGVSWSPNSGR